MTKMRCTPNSEKQVVDGTMSHSNNSSDSWSTKPRIRIPRSKCLNHSEKLLMERYVIQYELIL